MTAAARTDPGRTIPDNVRNTLVIMTDQHRVDTIGCLGNPRARTPHLDALGAEGFAFTHAFTPTAICTPARASLLTGKHPVRHQVLANPEWNIAYSTALPTTAWTYTQCLRDHGYNVGLVGKYHVGTNLPDAFGMDDDSFWGAENPVADPRYVAWLEENGHPPVVAHDLWRGTLPGDREGHLIAARLRQGEEATFERFLADRAIERLRQYAEDWRRDGTPFSLDVHFFGPHLPYFLPDEWFDLIDPDLVTLPESFGDILVGKPPVQQNYATYWSTSSFSPEQWKKLIAVYWGYVAMIDHEIGRIMDAACELDGRSIVDLTRGEEVEDWREDIVCEFHGHHFPLQQRMLRSRDFKLVVSPESINELYDLRSDPSEMTNVHDAPIYDGVRQELAIRLHTRLRERGDHSFAKWMAAMTDFEVPLVNTARSDLDEVTIG